jgi:hypothetical protein
MLVLNTIRSSMDAVEQYAAGIVSVIRGEKDAVAALREAESG